MHNKHNRLLDMKEGIVLVQGILSNKYLMYGLEKYLKRHGFAFLNLTYPSYKYEILNLTEFLYEYVEAFGYQLLKVHFIGHSTGGLLIWAYINRYNLVI